MSQPARNGRVIVHPARLTSFFENDQKIQALVQQLKVIMPLRVTASKLDVVQELKCCKDKNRCPLLVEEEAINVIQQAKGLCSSCNFPLVLPIPDETRHLSEMHFVRMSRKRCTRKVNVAGIMCGVCHTLWMLSADKPQFDGYQRRLRGEDPVDNVRYMPALTITDLKRDAKSFVVPSKTGGDKFYAFQWTRQRGQVVIPRRELTREDMERLKDDEEKYRNHCRINGIRYIDEEVLMDDDMQSIRELLDSDVSIPAQPDGSMNDVAVAPPDYTKYDFLMVLQIPLDPRKGTSFYAKPTILQSGKNADGDDLKISKDNMLLSNVLVETIRSQFPISEFTTWAQANIKLGWIDSKANRFRAPAAFGAVGAWRPNEKQIAIMQRYEQQHMLLESKKKEIKAINDKLKLLREPFTHMVELASTHGIPVVGRASQCTFEMRTSKQTPYPVDEEYVSKTLALLLSEEKIALSSEQCERVAKKLFSDGYRGLRPAKRGMRVKKPDERSKATVRAKIASEPVSEHIHSMFSSAPSMATPTPMSMSQPTQPAAESIPSATDTGPAPMAVNAKGKHVRPKQQQQQQR